MYNVYYTYICCNKLYSSYVLFHNNKSSYDLLTLEKQTLFYFCRFFIMYPKVALILLALIRRRGVERMFSTTTPLVWKQNL